MVEKYTNRLRLIRLLTSSIPSVLQLEKTPSSIVAPVSLMDLPSLSLPPELLDLICAHLHAKHDIQSARLVSRAFAASTNPLLRHAHQSPSLLFGGIHPDLFSTTEGVASSAAFTLWTWLDIPSETTLHDPDTDAGRRFGATMIASCNAASVGEGSTGPKHGPKASCWGRLIESQDCFCIVTRKSVMVQR